MNSAAIPPLELLQQQAEWLAPARARLLRQAGIAHRQQILDLGAGFGVVTPELVRRGGGPVVALDREWKALQQLDTAVAAAGDAHCLPFASATFDLVFCQCVLLWLADLKTAVTEIWRVLRPHGILIALEPDYGGMIEHPPDIASRELWISVLQRLGAHPYIGRTLPGLLSQAKFQVRVQLLDNLPPPDLHRFLFLRSLPLLPAEKNHLEQIEKAARQATEAWQQITHLPFFLISATKT